MSNGENLLSLQEVDIELSQLKDKLAQLPELKDLAKKRRALAAAKEELLKVVALRKDAELPGTAHLRHFMRPASVQRVRAQAGKGHAAPAVLLGHGGIRIQRAL